MKLKKLLIVPGYKLIQEEAISRRAMVDHAPAGSFARYTAAEEQARSLRHSSDFSFLRYLRGKFAKRPLVYNGELICCADMPRVLGRENVFLFGKYHPHLHTPAPDFSRYPSCHGTPEHTSVGENEIASVIKDVDAVLVSTRAGRRGDLVVREARKRDIPVAILDFGDQESIFAGGDVNGELFCGFKRGEDFDLYFKKDLPLGYGTEVIRPLAPVPVRPESLQCSIREKDVDIFYAGRSKIGRETRGNQPERAETLRAVKANFPNALLVEHTSTGTFMSLSEYCDNLSRSKMALAPLARGWDSVRYCEIGMAHHTVLVAPKPYAETTEPFLRDGVNAILYDTVCRDGRYHLANEAELVEKIGHYLGRPGDMMRLSEAWRADVLAGHTIFARCKYIVESIEKAC